MCISLLITLENQPMLRITKYYVYRMYFLFMTSGAWTFMGCGDTAAHETGIHIKDAGPFTGREERIMEVVEASVTAIEMNGFPEFRELIAANYITISFSATPVECAANSEAGGCTYYGIGQIDIALYARNTVDPGCTAIGHELMHLAGLDGRHQGDYWMRNAGEESLEWAILDMNCYAPGYATK
jgi:hypothetical protein